MKKKVLILSGSPGRKGIPTCFVRSSQEVPKRQERPYK